MKTIFFLLTALCSVFSTNAQCSTRGTTSVKQANDRVRFDWVTLKQVDFDGRSSLSDIVIVRDSSPSTNTIRVFPNPGTSVFNISSTQKIDAVHFFAPNGTEVFLLLSSDDGTSRTYDANKLADGIYYARIDAGGNTTTQKITVLK